MKYLKHTRNEILTALKSLGKVFVSRQRKEARISPQVTESHALLNCILETDLFCGGSQIAILLHYTVLNFKINSMWHFASTH